MFKCLWSDIWPSMRRPGPDETLAHAGWTEAGRTVVLTPLGHGLVARPGPHGEAPLAIGGNIVVRVTGADGAGAVRGVVVTVDLAPGVSGGVARPRPRPSTRVSSWNWRCNNTSLSGGALSNSLSCTFIILSGLIIVVILLSHGGDALANNGNVRASLEGLHGPAGPVTRAPVPTIPVGPLEHALVTRPHREAELGRDLVGSHRVRDPELGVSSLDHGQSRISLVKTLLSWILIYVVISTKTNLNITRMVCRDVRGDGDDLARLVLPHNDSIGKLAARSLVLLHHSVPGVTTYATFAANSRTPLMTLSTTEALHPLIVLGVLREAIVMHGGPGWRLYHAAMTRHLEDDGEAEEDDINEHVDVRDDVRHL